MLLPAESFLWSCFCLCYAFVWINLGSKTYYKLWQSVTWLLVFEEFIAVIPAFVGKVDIPCSPLLL